MINPMRKKEFYIIFGIILIAAFLRFYQLGSVPAGLYPDEAMNGNNALEALKTGEWKVFYSENNGREGLFMNTQALFLKVIGENEPWVLRLTSAVFGTFSVLGLFFLLFELAGLAKINSPFLIAASGSFMMAVSFWHILFSRIGFRAVMAPFFLTWALYFLLLSFRKRWFRAALLSGVALGLGAYTYIAYRLMPFLLLLFIQPFRHKREFWHLAFGVFASALIVFIPLGVFFATHPADFLGRTSQVSVFSSPNPSYELGKNILLTIGMFFFRGDGNWLIFWGIHMRQLFLNYNTFVPFPSYFDPD